jgi:hypothetical protein
MSPAATSSLLQISEYFGKTSSTWLADPAFQLFITDGRLDAIVKRPVVDFRWKKIPQDMPSFITEMHRLSEVFESRTETFVNNKFGH